jgi:dihydrofolate synthase/folylpolyglutamate synthase
VHVYTSPHLVHFHERVRLAGTLVDDATLTAAFEEAEAANAGEPITVFEITTAAAFLLFSRVPADLLVLEVGLGGRFDATSVVEKPAATAIASVSMDHMEFLGETLGAIAYEKAGIIRPGVPCATGVQAPEALETIARVAAERGAPLLARGRDWRSEWRAAGLHYSDARGTLDLPPPGLAGPHQADNAGIAIAALRAWNPPWLTDLAIARGVASAEWPARLQRLRGALAARLPGGFELWLDGGHNAEGGRVIAAALGDLEERVPRPLVVIVGMMANKDAAGFLANFAGLTRHIIAVPIPDRAGAMPVQMLVDAGRGLGMRVETADSAGAALQSLQRLAYEVPPRILICGSLYLAGHVLAENGTLPQ